MNLQTWLRTLAHLPEVLEGHWTALRALGLAVEGLRDGLDAKAHAPVLATLTVLCERRERIDRSVSGGEVDDWVPTVLGAERWICVGESVEIVIVPHFVTRNFRWFVSGDPAINVVRFVVGNDVQDAGSGGYKYGDSSATCHLGVQLRVTLERRRCPS